MPFFPTRDVRDGRTATLGLVAGSGQAESFNTGLVDSAFAKLNRILPPEPDATQVGLVAGVLDDLTVGWLNPKQQTPNASLVLGPHKDPPPPKAGEIQWANGHFQGFNGTAWVNLD